MQCFCPLMLCVCEFYSSTPPSTVHLLQLSDDDCKDCNEMSNQYVHYLLFLPVVVSLQHCTALHCTALSSTVLSLTRLDLSDVTRDVT